MIAVASPNLTDAPWQDGFLKLAPHIQRRASWLLRRWRPQDRDEAIAEVMAHATVAYARLASRGREHVATAGSFVGFALRHLRAGRRVGCRSNVRDLTSPYAQHRHPQRIGSLDRFDDSTGAWREIVVEDRRCGPAETAVARLDIEAWMQSLPAALQRVAASLAAGEQTNQAAQRMGISPSRVSQLRRQFEKSWLAFQGASKALSA